MNGSIRAAVAYYSYVPLVALASALALVKMLAQAGVLDRASFGALSQMLLVSLTLQLLAPLGSRLAAEREAPIAMAAGRRHLADAVVIRAILVTTLVTVAAFVTSAFGLTPPQLTRAEFAAALLHGLAAGWFTTLLILQKMTLQMQRYARQLVGRTVLVSVAGLGVALATGNAMAVVVTEFLVMCFAVAEVVARSLVSDARSPRMQLKRLARKAALVRYSWSPFLLFNGIVGFLSINIDRLVASAVLSRDDFAIYSFGWLIVLVAINLQAAVSAGFLPLISRRASNDPVGAARYTLKLCLSIGAGAAVCALLFALLAPSIVGSLFPKYSQVLQIMPLFLAAAVLRVGELWGNFCIANNDERPLAVIQVGALATGFSLWWVIYGARTDLQGVAMLTPAIVIAIYIAGLLLTTARAAIRNLAP